MIKVWSDSQGLVIIYVRAYYFSEKGNYNLILVFFSHKFQILTTIYLRKIYQPFMTIRVNSK